MRVLHLSTNDTSGGAARAAYRLHKGLRSQGVDSRMLVQKKESSDDHVYGLDGKSGAIYSRLRREADQLPVKRYRDRDSEIFSPAWLPERRAEQIARHDPDILHLHWIAGGFLQLETINQLDVPIVWTFHDMWPLTGGCHYTKTCTKYTSECKACPHLSSDGQNDLAFKIWNRKEQAWDESDFVIVTPSQWLAEQTRASSLLSDFRVEMIPNGLDLNEFKPRERSEGIRRFDLKEEKRYILFGSAYQTSRKGSDLLQQALKQFSKEDGITALTFGAVREGDEKFPLPVHHLGQLSENELQLAYSTADLTVVPSREDNLPNIAVESIASGTPCVSFDIGGLPDIVDHGDTGYLAEPFNTDDLANGISWVLSDGDRLAQLSEQAQRIAKQRFSIETVAKMYKNLYEEL